MNVVRNVFCFCLIFVGVNVPISVFANTQNCWEGRYENGDKITESDMRRILKLHEMWLSSNGLKGVRADFSNADLSGIDFEKIKSLEEKMPSRHLVGSNLVKANFYGTNLTGANLSCVDLSGANLSRANLTEANFSGADLSKSNLTYVDLYKTNFGGVNLYSADLSFARFVLTDISDAQLAQAIMHYCVYESVAASPSINYVGGIKGLDTLVFNSSDGYYGLVMLRAALKAAGLRDPERQVTLAIEKGKLQYKNLFEKTFHIVFFYWPCLYGESPLRPIAILLCLIPVFSFFYYYFLRYSDEKNSIYKVWPVERMLTDVGSDIPERLVCKEFDCIGYALYFSILSASKIGWRDLNLGSWIVNMQRCEYILKATGWVRMLSGFQSLLSVYLLALSILTYFGRPFG